MQLHYSAIPASFSKDFFLHDVRGKTRNYCVVFQFEY